MNKPCWLLISSLALAMGCTDGMTDGGMTDDFGDLPNCKREQSFDLNEETPLGFSGKHMLHWVEGRYRFPFHWSAPCDGASCSRSEQCDALGARSVPSVAGTDTFVTVELHPIGAQAIAELPDETQTRCARAMRVPVSVRIESEDGAFALEVEDLAWAEKANYTEVRSDALSQAAGSILAELPDGISLELGFGGGDHDYWYFDMYLTSDRLCPPLLKGAVAGSSVGEGPRSQYQQR